MTDHDVLARARARGEEKKLPYFGAVTPAEAARLLEADASARLVDVRTEAEWDWVGHPPDAVLIEWNTYPDGTRNPSFGQALQDKVPDKSAPVLFLCRSGARSHGAAAVAAQLGYTRAMNVLEGFEGNKDDAGHRGTVGGWKVAGLPWVQS
jgi:rhodanese-related sulfurtransferase